MQASTLDGAIYHAALGKVVTELRKSKGLSQDDLALSAGISQPTLSRIEKGDTRLRYVAFKGIAGALGCALADLDSLAEEVANRVEQSRKKLGLDLPEDDEDSRELLSHLAALFAKKEVKSFLGGEEGQSCTQEK